LARVEAAPDYYPNQVSLVLVAFVFFHKVTDPVDQTITERLTITCSGGTPNVTVASYLGTDLVTPTATP
jgi:hypothetical protein